MRVAWDVLGVVAALWVLAVGVPGLDGAVVDAAAAIVLVLSLWRLVRAWRAS